MPITTASQRRAAAKAEYDAFFAQCPSRQLLERISDKWVALVLAALGGDGPGTAPGDEPQPMRFTELQRRISGVSQKMLTQTLRALERDGLVTRTVTPTVPVTVSYELTDVGRSLQGLMQGIKAWAEGHMEEVLTHRGSFDQGQDAAAG